MWSSVVIIYLLVQNAFTAPTTSPFRCGGYRGVAQSNEIRACQGLARRLANPAFTPGADRRRRWAYLGPQGPGDKLGMLPYSWLSSDGKCLIGLRVGPGQAGDTFALKEIFEPAMALIETCLEVPSRRTLGGIGRVGDNQRITLEIDVIHQGFLSTANDSVGATEASPGGALVANETVAAPLSDLNDATER